MSDQASRAQQSPDQPLGHSTRLAQRLRRRSFWIAALGLGTVVLSTYWVWAVIAAMFTLFLVFAVDDEVKEIERDC